MKRILTAAILTFAALSAGTFAQSAKQTKPAPQLYWGGPASKELKGKANGHTYRVLLRIQNAKAGNRKIALSSASDKSLAGDHFLINGAQTWGFDGIPKEWVGKNGTARKALEEHATEIVQLDVWIDGKRIRIPRRKHETMLMPDLSRSSALFSDDGKLFFLIVNGSDGAGSWTARWVISRTGKVQVEVAGGG